MSKAPRRESDSPSWFDYRFEEMRLSDWLDGLFRKREITDGRALQHKGKNPNWFEMKAELEKRGVYHANLRFQCPCCRYPTLQTLFHEICGICGWQVDGLETEYPADFVIGGPNDDYSLLEAQNNFSKNTCMFRESDPQFAATCDGRDVRNELCRQLDGFRGREYVDLPEDLRDLVDRMSLWRLRE